MHVNFIWSCNFIPPASPSFCTHSHHLHHITEFNVHPHKFTVCDFPMSTLWIVGFSLVRIHCKNMHDMSKPIVTDNTDNEASSKKFNNVIFWIFNSISRIPVNSIIARWVKNSIDPLQFSSYFIALQSQQLSDTFRINRGKNVEQFREEGW